MPADSLDQLAALMLETGRQIRENTKGKDEFSPYTALRLEALGFIASAKDPTMRDVADHFSITPPSATSLINGLVNSGAIARKPDKVDRRVTRLTITAAGKRAYAASHAQLTRHMKSVFKNLSTTEQNALINIFKKLSRIYTND
jgi:DNA-binding MarR family transcriptional regulator